MQALDLPENPEWVLSFDFDGTLHDPASASSVDEETVKRYNLQLVAPTTEPHVYEYIESVTIIPITPGSAGVSEIALVGMLTPIAGTEYVNEIAAGVLLYRLLTWILLIPAGLTVLGAWRLQQRRQSVSIDVAG